MVRAPAGNGNASRVPSLSATPDPWTAVSGTPDEGLELRPRPAESGVGLVAAASPVISTSDVAQNFACAQPCFQMRARTDRDACGKRCGRGTCTNLSVRGETPVLFGDCDLCRSACPSVARAAAFAGGRARRDASIVPARPGIDHGTEIETGIAVPKSTYEIKVDLLPISLVPERNVS